MADRGGRVLLTALLAGVTAVTLVGCGPDNSNNGDLKGVNFRKPDKIEGYLNVDGQPNLARLCIDGQAFLTTSRDLDADIRVPEWNS